MLRTACLGVVLLVCFAVPAASVPVDPDAPDGIAAVFSEIVSGQPYILRTDGLVYVLEEPFWEWAHMERHDVPIPVSEILDWRLGFLVAQNGDWWWQHQYGEWDITPPAPWLPISVRDGGQKRTSTLGQNYPNPFNPTTRISFELPESGPVRLEIYTAAGVLLTTLVNENLSAGPHEITWDGYDTGGRQVASGTYFYQLIVDGNAQSKKMLVLK